MAEQIAEDDGKLAAEWAAMSGDGDKPAEPEPSHTGETPRVLNQNEIDSLLGFVDGDGGGRDGSAIRSPIDSALVSDDRLRTLEVAFRRPLRRAAPSLLNVPSATG